MLSRRKARKRAVEILYLQDITNWDCQLLKDFWPSFFCFPDEDGGYQFSQWLVQGTLTEKAKIDHLIQEFAENWELARMAPVDRNILRLSTYELLAAPETPVSVIIDEAVELAKEFSTADSGKFVNGVLDQIKIKVRPSALHR